MLTRNDGALNARSGGSLTSPSSNTLGTRRNLLQTALLLLMILTTPAFGQQDILAEASKFQDRFSDLSKEFFASERRILSTERTFAAQENALIILKHVHEKLYSNSREFRVLQQTLILALLVTDIRAIPAAEKILALQRDYMIDNMKDAVEYIEKAIPDAGDKETARLLLQTRDLLRSGNEFMKNITLQLPKPKVN